MISENCMSRRCLNIIPEFSRMIKCIPVNENVGISIQMLVRFVPYTVYNRIDKMSVLILVKAWCRTVDKPLPEPKMTTLIKPTFENQSH